MASSLLGSQLCLITACSVTLAKKGNLWTFINTQDKRDGNPLGQAPGSCRCGSPASHDRLPFLLDDIHID